MADNPNGFSVWKVLGGSTGTHPTEEGKLTANEACKKGDPLVWSGGYLTKGDATSAAIVGIALHDVEAEAGVVKDVLFVPVMPGVQFQAQCSGAPAVTVRGTDVDIEGSTGVFEVDEDATAVGIFKVLGLVDGYDWGDTNARVYGEFTASGYTG